VRSLLLSLAFLSFLPAAQAAEPGDMTFRLGTDRNCESRCAVHIVADGRITEESYARYHEVASTSPAGTPVYLNSRGGSFIGGIYLGLALREHRAAVRVQRGATCASACAYAFLGGVDRNVPEGARLGVHRFYAVDVMSGERALDYEQAISRQATDLLTKYVATMGVKQSLVGFMGDVDPSSMRFMSKTELRRFGVVTNGTAVARASVPSVTAAEKPAVGRLQTAALAPARKIRPGQPQPLLPAARAKAAGQR